jgi:hypothetical protein
MENLYRDLPVHEVLYRTVTLLLETCVRSLKGVIVIVSVNVNVICKVTDVLNNGCPTFFWKPSPWYLYTLSKANAG